MGPCMLAAVFRDLVRLLNPNIHSEGSLICNLAIIVKNGICNLFSRHLNFSHAGCMACICISTLKTSLHSPVASSDLAGAFCQRRYAVPRFWLWFQMISSSYRPPGLAVVLDQQSSHCALSGLGSGSVFVLRSLPALQSRLSESHLQCYRICYIYSMIRFSETIKQSDHGTV